MAIRITSNIEQFRANMLAKARAVRKAGIDSHQMAARFMWATARRTAPKDSGALIMAITKQEGTNESYVISNKPMGADFPYNVWVAGEAPYRTLQVKKYVDNKGIGYVNINGHWVAVPGGKMVYKHAPNWHWTATKERYWHFAILDTRKYFKDITSKQVNQALNAKVGGV